MLFCFDSEETVEKIGQSVNVVIIIGKDRMGIDRVREREREILKYGLGIKGVMQVKVWWFLMKK